MNKGSQYFCLWWGLFSISPSVLLHSRCLFSLSCRFLYLLLCMYILYIYMYIMYVWMSTSLDTQTVSIPLQSLRWIVLHVLSRAAPNMTFRGAKRLARTWPRSAHRWAILLDVAQGKTVRPPSTLVLVGCRCWDCHPTITNPTKLALLGGSGKVFMQIM